MKCEYITPKTIIIVTKCIYNTYTYAVYFQYICNIVIIWTILKYIKYPFVFYFTLASENSILRLMWFERTLIFIHYICENSKLPHNSDVCKPHCDKLFNLNRYSIIVVTTSSWKKLQEEIYNINYKVLLFKKTFYFY